MEIVSFINDLRKKGKAYQDVWMPIIYQFDVSEVKVIKITVPLAITRSYYYTILNYGLEQFPKHISSFTLTKKKQTLILKALSLKQVATFKKKQQMLQEEIQSKNRERKQLLADKKSQLITEQQQQAKEAEALLLQQQTQKPQESHLPIDAKNNKIYTSEPLQLELVAPTVEQQPIPKQKTKRIVKSKYPDELYVDVIDYFNEVTGFKYRPESKATRTLIDNRLGEGFTVENLKKVIEIKAEEWLGNPKYEMYLRPATLFNEDKFESYLNQKRTSKNKTHQNAYDTVAKATEIGWTDNTR